MSWYNSGSWIKVHSYRVHSTCPLVGYPCIIEKIFLSFLPCRGHKRIPGRQTTAANRPNQTDFRCFRFQFSFRSLCPAFRFNSMSPFRSLCPSFRFNSMSPFRSLPPSFRFASSFPRVTSALSFHVLYSVRYFFPFVSTLRVVSTLRFRSLRLSFRVTCTMRYFARFKSYIPFVSSSLSFQLFPAVCSVLPSDLILPLSSQLFLSVRCVLSFMSSLLFHLLLPFFRINSYVLFVSFFLPFQLVLSIRCVCAFVFLSFQFSSSICYFLSFA